jgi:hypothetical protein
METVQSGSISAGSPIWLQASALIAWRLYTVTGWFAACSAEFSNIVRYDCGPCPLSVGSPFLVLCSPIHGCVKGRGEPCSEAIEHQNQRDNNIMGSVSAGNHHHHYAMSIGTSLPNARVTRSANSSKDAELCYFAEPCASSREHAFRACQ